MSQEEKNTILGIMEPRFVSLEVKDQITNVDEETPLGPKGDDDIEIVYDIEEEATNDVNAGIATPSEHSTDESEAPSKQLIDDRAALSEYSVDKSDDDSTPCLTCGRMILNKFLKIHYKTHRKERTEEAEKIDTSDRNEKNTPWEVIPVKPSEKLKTQAILKDNGDEQHESVSDNKLKIDETPIEKPGRDKTATCVFCTKVMNKKSLTKHIKTLHKSSARNEAHKNPSESSRKPFAATSGNLLFRKCKICMKNIKASKFERHLKLTHSGSSDSKCKLCYIRFTRKDRLRTHVKTAHPEDKHLLTKDIKRSECNFKCDSCDVKFITKSVLEYHTERKHGRGDEQCKYCSRRYLTTSKLKKHIRTVHLRKVQGL